MQIYKTAISRPRPATRLVGACLAVLLGWPVQAQPDLTAPSLAPTALPNLGDSSEMSPVAERHLGDRIARELFRDPDYVDDPVIKEYVQDIWWSLIAASRARGEMPDALYDAYAWEILMGRDRTVNAFALPGGYFGLHLGLVAIVNTRDELASVLAHELSHVTQRHISRTIARQNAQAPWLLGSMILGVLAASKDPTSAQAMLVGGQAASAQSQLNYSRGMEREADRIGFNVANQAGYAPQGFVSMFQKLQQSSRLNDAGGFPYLRTHPLTTERIADMQSRVQQLGSTAKPQTPTWDHAMIAARANVLCNASVDALQNWQRQAEPANLATQTEAAQIGILYGASLAALKLREFALAEATLVRLANRTAAVPAAQHLTYLLGVEFALTQRQVTRAVDLAKALDLRSRPALLYKSEVDMLSNRAGDSTQILQTWLVDHPHDAQVWQQLSAAYGALGHTVAAVRAEAEVHAALLDYSGALTRMRAAQDMVRKGIKGADYVDASIVDTRVHQLDFLVKEQALER